MDGVRLWITSRNPQLFDRGSWRDPGIISGSAEVWYAVGAAQRTYPRRISGCGPADPSRLCAESEDGQASSPLPARGGADCRVRPPPLNKGGDPDVAEQLAEDQGWLADTGEVIVEDPLVPRRSGTRPPGGGCRRRLRRIDPPTRLRSPRRHRPDWRSPSRCQRHAPGRAGTAAATSRRP